MRPDLFQTMRADRPPLRIGLLLESATLPRWSAEALEHIENSGIAKIELVIYNAEARTAPVAARSLPAKIAAVLGDKKRRKEFTYSLYQRWDRRNLDPAVNPHVPVDCSARFSKIESLVVTPVTKRFVHRFPPEALRAVQDKQLDVLVRFGFNILRGGILTAAKYGMWSYHHGDNDFYRGGPAYFWEVYESNPISGAILQVLTEELDAGQVLCKGLFSTEAGLSHVRNRVQPYWGASTFLMQKLRQLQAEGWEAVKRDMIPPAPYLGRKKIYTAPGNGEMIRWLGPAIARKAWRRLTGGPEVDHWRLAIRRGGPRLAAAADDPDVSGFKWLEAPAGHFHADPFLLEHGGKAWAFFEDYDYGKKRGAIACAAVEDGRLGPVEVVLDRPYHLSYPHVFRDGGELYMIPETGANGTVELYRCEAFPGKWRLERDLFRGKAVDTTVWIEDGVYWFFVTLQEPRGRAAQLWLFSAPSLTGQWTPHPANPISTDVRNCRGAGAVFRDGGRLYRPSQDCGGVYGRSFALNEITTWTATTYKERPLATVKPVWGPRWIGTHSYARAGDIEIIDGCERIPVGAISGIGSKV